MYLSLFEPAKLQVKPNTLTKKQASETLVAKEAESSPIQTYTTQDSELPGPSVQPIAFDDNDVVTEPQKGSGDDVVIEEETVTGGKNSEDSISGAETTQSRGTRRRNR